MFCYYFDNSGFKVGMREEGKLGVKIVNAKSNSINICSDSLIATEYENKLGIAES